MTGSSDADRRLVLLPGMDGTGRLFAPLLRAFPKSFHPLVVSYPTDVPSSYADLLEIVRQALPTTGDFVLVAESFSGPIALRLAAEPPAGLRSLVLASTFARMPLPARVACRVLGGSLTRLPRSLRRRMLLGPGGEELFPALDDALGEVTSAVWTHRIRGSAREDVTPLLRRIRVPVLLLRGTEDRLVSRRAVATLMRELPDAQSVEFAGPHLLLQVEPTRAAAAIESFLDATAAAQRQRPV